MLRSVASLLMVSASMAVGAETEKGPAGYWIGQLSLPPGPLDVRVEFSPAEGNAWNGLLAVPAQGIRDFKLNVTVEAARVTFAMAGVPGDPTYVGTLSSDGTSISGQFTQGAATFPFALQRTTAAVAKAEPIVPAGIAGEGLAGNWLGILKPTPNLMLRLALEVKNPDARQLDVVLVSLDQQNARMPASYLRETDGVVSLEFARPVASFEGKLNANGSELAGEWTQGSRKTPLTFKRQVRSAAAPRPQEPARPFPYREQEVTIENKPAKVTLAGTLTVPATPGPHPVVVLISGSGPQDRDHHVAGHRTFLVLADYLTRQGIAVLRYDDRGTAKSTGKFSSALQSDFVDDALACVKWLREQPGLDPTRVGLVGLSEGGMIAPRAAALSPEIAFIVLLAGPGLPMEQVMIRQARDIGAAMGLKEDLIAKNELTQREVLAILRSDRPQEDAVSAVRNLIDAQNAGLSDEQRQALGLPKAGAPNPQLQLAESPWLRDALRIDPRDALQRVKCPVLALGGGLDLQVASKENLAAIEAALNAGGNRDFKTKELPGLNHLFQTVRSGAPYEYALSEETMSPVALKEISDWINRVTPKPATQPKSE